MHQFSASISVHRALGWLVRHHNSAASAPILLATGGHSHK